MRRWPRQKAACASCSSALTRSPRARASTPRAKRSLPSSSPADRNPSICAASARSCGPRATGARIRGCGCRSSTRPERLSSAAARPPSRASTRWGRSSSGAATRTSSAASAVTRSSSPSTSSPTTGARYGCCLSCLRPIAVGVPAASVLAATAGCGSKSQTTPSNGVAPVRFVAQVDNPWFPLTPGKTLRYLGQADGVPGVDVFAVTHRTKRILGVNATVVHDQVILHGRVVEDTLDYYAQDARGNVWYLGEDTKELDRHGRVK